MTGEQSRAIDPGTKQKSLARICKPAFALGWLLALALGHSNPTLAQGTPSQEFCVQIGSDAPAIVKHLGLDAATFNSNFAKMGWKYSIPLACTDMDLRIARAWQRCSSDFCPEVFHAYWDRKYSNYCSCAIKYLGASPSEDPLVATCGKSKGAALNRCAAGVTEEVQKITKRYEAEACIDKLVKAKEKNRAQFDAAKSAAGVTRIDDSNACLVASKL